VKKICDQVGPRLAGSEEEKRAGDIIHKKLKDFCNEVKQEEFTCHPQGFLDFIWITALFYFLGMLAYFFINPLLSSLLIFIALAIYSVQQNFLYEMVDFLFPKKTSFHIVGKIKPHKKPRNLVLLSGHHDSAYEFPLISKLGEKSAYLIILAVIIAILSIFFGLIKTFLIITNDFPQNSDPFRLIRDIQQLTILNAIDLVQIIVFSIGIILVLIFALYLLY
jgi:hypothetical protein